MITIDRGEHAGDPFEATGIASYELECHAAHAARRLAGAVDAARLAIAFASYADVLDDDL